MFSKLVLFASDEFELRDSRYDITPLFGAGLILLFYLNMIAAWSSERLHLAGESMANCNWTDRDIDKIIKHLE